MSTKHTIACPQCGKTLNVTSEMLGRTGKCNACGNRFVIKLPEPVDELTPIEDLTPIQDLTPIDEYGLQPVLTPAGAKAQATSPRSFASVVPTTPVKPATAAAKPSPVAPGPPKAPSPLPVVGLLVGGGVLALALCGGVVAVAAYLFTGKDPHVAGGKEAVAGGKEQVASAPGGIPTVVEDPATIRREPKVGPNSWVPSHPLAAADPATWKVTVEKFPPLPKEALTAIPLPTIQGSVVHFTTPDVAQFAFISIASVTNAKRETVYPITWAQHSLLEPKPVKVVTIQDQTHSSEITNLKTALSPKGDLLAYVHYKEPGTIYVWKDDGSPAGRIEVPDATREDPINQFWLSGDSRVLVLTKDWLKGYDLASGNEVYALPERPRFPPAFTRGNKFFAVPAADRISFYQTADGSPAGEILLGEHWSAKDLEAKDRKQQATAVAFHPQGELMATLSRGLSGDVLIAKWDLAQGKPLEQCLIPKRDLLTQSFWLESIWMGEQRLLLSSGALFDFDKHTWIHHYGLGIEYRHLEGPDARWWRKTQYVANRVKEHFGITDRDTEFLAASTLPSRKWEAEMASSKLDWHPGYRMSLETAPEVPPEERAQLISAVADAIAERGYTVDPQAKHRMKILAWVTGEPSLGRIIGSPGAPKDRVYGGSMMLELVDEKGERLMFIPSDSAQQRIAVQTEGLHNCWVALGQEAKKSLQLPRHAHYNEAHRGAQFTPVDSDRAMIDGFEAE